ncbi:MAG: hypothetical protein ACFUZC_03395 [Chthoniobacteraceae bacterium]
MFTKFLTLALVIPLTGCAQIEALNSKALTAVETWWNSEATQQGLKIGLKAAGAALVSAAESATVDYLTDGTVHWTDVGKTAGSSALRQIELTDTANQTVVAAATVADAVLQASSNTTQADSVKTAVIASLTAAQASGADASGALEGVAQALDAQPTTTSTSGK